MRLFNLLKMAFQKLGLISDYIVEIGKDGDWTWQKYNSGIIEIFGVHEYENEEISCSRKYGNYYISESLTLSLPFELVDYVHAAVSASVSGAGADFVAKARMNSESVVAFNWCNGNAYAVYGSPCVMIQISGYWKTPTWGGVIHSLLFQRRWIPCGYSPC